MIDVKERLNTDFWKLPTDDRVKAIKFIKNCFIPKKGINRNHSSYGLKHILQNNPFCGVYLTEKQFIGAMISCGFAPTFEGEHAYFCISERSPALNFRRR